MLGFTAIALSNSRPQISPEAANLILRTGTENISALIEELGLKNKAIYFPSAMRGGKPQALIPLSGNVDMTRLKNNIPGRLIVRFGSNPEDMAIAITTPGSINISKLGVSTGPTPDEIENALNYILTGVLDIANNARVTVTGKVINVEIKSPRLSNDDTWYYRCLGSPAASISATVVSESMGKPVRITDETVSGGKSRIAIEIID